MLSMTCPYCRKTSTAKIRNIQINATFPKEYRSSKKWNTLMLTAAAVLAGLLAFLLIQPSSSMEDMGLIKLGAALVMGTGVGYLLVLASEEVYTLTDDGVTLNNRFTGRVYVAWKDIQRLCWNYPEAKGSPPYSLMVYTTDARLAWPKLTVSKLSYADSEELKWLTVTMAGLTLNSRAAWFQADEVYEKKHSG